MSGSEVEIVEPEVECPNGRHEATSFCFLCSNTGFVSLSKCQEWLQEQEAQKGKCREVKIKFIKRV